MDKEPDDTFPEGVEEHEEFITANFVGADGKIYQGGSLEGIPCPTCNRLITDHTKAEVRACADIDKTKRRNL